MNFQGLRQFGPTLIHHTQLKVREGVRTEGFMMVDSPGMIDSPGSINDPLAGTSPHTSGLTVCCRSWI